MRQPFAFKQWDSFACETACTIQLLYINHLIEEDGILKLIRTIDGTVGRTRNEADWTFGNLSYILNAGFHVRTIELTSLQKIKGPRGLEYLRQVWKKEGCGDETIATIDGMFPKLQSRAELGSAIKRRFSRSWESKERLATAGDISKHLRDGWTLACLLPGADPGYTHSVLAVPNTAQTCWVYDPGPGTVKERQISVLSHQIFPALTAYKLP